MPEEHPKFIDCPETGNRVPLHRGIVKVTAHSEVGVVYAMFGRHDKDLGVDLEFPRFHSRDTSNWPVIIQQNNCWQMPPAFHAMLWCLPQLLCAYHSRPMKLEGAPDSFLSVRGILQASARLYAVDPNDVANFYPNARNWLSVPTHQHPETLQGLIAFVEMQADINMQ